MSILKRDSKPSRFAICKRGYDVTEVENYIEAEKAKTESVMIEQKERISALREQCDRLSREAAELRDREDGIKKALMSATDKADKMTLDIKLRYAAELDRLKLFRAKWTGAYEELKERYHFSKDALNMESVALNTEIELTKFLANDFSLAKGSDEDDMERQFKREVARLAPKESGVEELRSRLKEAGMKRHTDAFDDGCAESAAAFSLEDALSPKESLDDICRSLGLKKQ